MFASVDMCGRSMSRIRDKADANGIIERAGKRFASTQNALAKALGVSVSHVKLFLKNPDGPGMTSDSVYDIEAWRKFFDDQGRAGGDESPEDLFLSKKDKEELEVAKLEEQVRKLKIENEESEGRMISADEAIRVFTEMTRSFKEALMSMKDRLSSDLSGLPTPEVAKRIKEASRDVLRQLALGEWAKKKAFWSKVYATQSDLLKN